MNWKVTDDRVLVRRIEEPSNLLLTDKPKSIKGVVLAVGPGKRDEDGYREPVTVRPGQIVAFNSRWNDLSHAENVGTGADGKGKLERPLSYKLDSHIHLIREADIFGILPNEHVKAELVGTAIERTYMQNIEIKRPWNS